MDIAADMLAGQAGVEQLEKVRKVSDRVEDRLEGWARPIRPWLPGIGRFLIVVTFLEDALRILTQLSGALGYSRAFALAKMLISLPPQTKTTTSRSARSVRVTLFAPLTSAYTAQKHRGFPWGLSHLFLWTNVLVSSLRPLQVPRAS